MNCDLGLASLSRVVLVEQESQQDHNRGGRSQRKVHIHIAQRRRLGLDAAVDLGSCAARCIRWPQSSSGKRARERLQSLLISRIARMQVLKEVVLVKGCALGDEGVGE